MDVVQRLDALFSIDLFAILAGLSLTAVAMVASWLQNHRVKLTHEASGLTDQDKIKLIDEYMCAAYLLLGFVFFLFGLVATVVFDSVGEHYGTLLIVELSDVVVTGVPLLVGLAFVLAGAEKTVSFVTGRELRLPQWLKKAAYRSINCIADQLLPAKRR